jgi:hypothetical protein
MKRSVKKSLKDTMKTLAVAALVWAVAVTTFVSLPRDSQATSAPSFDLYRKTLPNIDVNQIYSSTRFLTVDFIASSLGQVLFLRS